MNTGFKYFRDRITRIGKQWATKDVYFWQTKDTYTAAFKPEYPNSSPRDMMINYIAMSGAYLNGDWELIRFDTEDRKFHSKYYQSYDNIRRIFVDS